MRKNLTIYDAWFLALFCLKVWFHADLSWFVVCLPYILMPLEALAYIYLKKYWLKIQAWLLIRAAKTDNYLRIKKAERIQRRYMKKNSQNKFKGL